MHPLTVEWPAGDKVTLTGEITDGADRQFPAGTHVVRLHRDNSGHDLALTVGEARRLAGAVRDLVAAFEHVTRDDQVSTVVGDLQLVVRAGSDCEAPHGAVKYGPAHAYVWLDICHQPGGVPRVWAAVGDVDALQLADYLERFVP